MPSFENMESLGYILLQRPLESLNIVYPDERLTASEDPKIRFQRSCWESRTESYHVVQGKVRLHLPVMILSTGAMISEESSLQMRLENIVQRSKA